MGGFSAVEIRDAHDHRADLDEVAEALKTISDLHHHIHIGKMFTASHFFAAVANNATAEYCMRIPSGVSAHAMITVGAGGDAALHLYEQGAAAVSNKGTLDIAVDQNRISKNTSGASCYFTPTRVSYTGTTLLVTYVPGGTKQSAIGSVNSYDEWILASGTTYDVAVRNISGSVKNIFIEFDWYEH